MLNELNELRAVEDDRERAREAWRLLARLDGAKAATRIILRDAVARLEPSERSPGHEFEELGKATAAVLAWIDRAGVESFTRRDAISSLSRTLFPTAEDVQLTLDYLELEGYLERMPPSRARGRGRPPSPTYRVLVTNGASWAAGHSRRKGARR